MTKTIGDVFRFDGDKPFLPLFVVYDRPPDYPDQVAVRLHVTNGEEVRPTSHVQLFPNLEEARKVKPADLSTVPRDPRDPPFLVESWL